MQNLLNWRLLGDGVPTLVIASTSQANNVNLSLLLATLNHDAGLITIQINGGMSTTEGLASVGVDGQDWTPVLLNNLSQFEASVAASPVPLRVIVTTAPLRDKLNEWAAANPNKITVLYKPDINNPL
jgi:hypothetical protein